MDVKHDEGLWEGEGAEEEDVREFEREDVGESDGEPCSRREEGRVTLTGEGAIIMPDTRALGDDGESEIMSALRVQYDLHDGQEGVVLSH